MISGSCLQGLGYQSYEQASSVQKTFSVVTWQLRWLHFIIGSASSEDASMEVKT